MPPPRDGDAAERGDEKGVETDLAAGLFVIGPVVMAYQSRRAEDQEAEDPVDRADEGGGDGAGGEGLHA